MFVDKAKIYVSSGHGGNGCVSFRREKFIEFGGPNGGDGGCGGDVWIECINIPATLLDFRYKQHYRAGNGRKGSGQKRTGADGKDIVLVVPPGTHVYDEQQENLIAHLDRIGQRVMLLKGGNGGFGNSRFKTSTDRAPRRANPGQDGMDAWIWVRLKLIADIGLIGLPNAGKSMFLASISAAKPKIADYPFTTLNPNLGMVDRFDQPLTVADIPGLITGAHEGIGLGDKFLGHIESCLMLFHLVDVSTEDVVASYRTVRQEIEAYGHGLSDKPEILLLTKADILPKDELTAKLKNASRQLGITPLLISSLTGLGVGGALELGQAEIANFKRLTAKPSGGDADGYYGWSP